MAKEQKAEIKEAFDLFDTDGTGTIEVCNGKCWQCGRSGVHSLRGIAWGQFPGAEAVAFELTPPHTYLSFRQPAGPPHPTDPHPRCGTMNLRASARNLSSPGRKWMAVFYVGKAGDKTKQGAPISPNSMLPAFRGELE